GYTRTARVAKRTSGPARGSECEEVAHEATPIAGACGAGLSGKLVDAEAALLPSPSATPPSAAGRHRPDPDRPPPVVCARRLHRQPLRPTDSRPAQPR